MKFNTRMVRGSALQFLLYQFLRAFILSISDDEIYLICTFTVALLFCTREQTGEQSWCC